jgi:hypothetical protein
MIDVMYDLSILDAIKYQNPSLETYKINPSQYIYKSIKLTAQFAQSNIYYSNYKDYKRNV